ncbi:2-dehydropantoate 2-reductase [Enterococcus sp. JM4C]|uniref:2-dehydropantoate 2-reductase n=1 Tax=Candidatus Enterococcus huntleyi TaxID=1857217 RepID=UPI001379E125|nr:2-dehydropantoate 2-reductase [Enterococcus sp. JM4C]KAF1299453.1 2-dehydropantoate 2-reductase [Enterococcus sp. JM4C]
MKIIIAGVGAMGSRFALMLHQANNEVLLVDGWQAHIDAIREEGLKANFNGEEVVAKIPIYHQTEVDKVDFSAELVILFTKVMQLEGMLQAMKPLIGKETKVLCLLNGIGHEDIIRNYVPLDNILLGNTMWTAGLEGPGKAKLFGNGSIDLQNLGTVGEQGAKPVIDVLNEAKLNAHYSENILSSIYKKACVNGTMNGLCTILDANMADFGETSVSEPIVNAIVSEFFAVAEAQNITLHLDEVMAQIHSCYNRETIGLHHPSMYQDLIINHRLTEIDYINGAIVRKGQEFGVPTPYCSFLTELVHAKEEIIGAK